MWWTDDEQAVKNSLCRAISGGSIYVSDKIGRTNPEILKSLCLEDGRIIRPDESVTPTADCLMTSPTTTDKIFKIRNRIGKNGVCAVFNINAENKPVSGRLAPNEIGIPNCDYAYCEYFSKERGCSSAARVFRFLFRTTMISACNTVANAFTVCFWQYKENIQVIMMRFVVNREYTFDVVYVERNYL